jgi:hypothetical protein
VWGEEKEGGRVNVNHIWHKQIHLGVHRNNLHVPNNTGHSHERSAVGGHDLNYKAHVCELFFLPVEDTMTRVWNITSVERKLVLLEECWS